MSARLRTALTIVTLLAAVLMLAVALHTDQTRHSLGTGSSPSITLAAQVTTVHRPAPPKRWAAMGYARSKIGKWYRAYPGERSGPDTFDCSGLVMAAYASAHVPYFGSSTYSMLGSGKLHRIPASQAHWGDLVFVSGHYHVELYVNARWTLGAMQTGTRVGYHPISWMGSGREYYRVAGAG